MECFPREIVGNAGAVAGAESSACGSTAGPGEARHGDRPPNCDKNERRCISRHPGWEPFLYLQQHSITARSTRWNERGTDTRVHIPIHANSLGPAGQLLALYHWRGATHMPAGMLWSADNADRLKQPQYRSSAVVHNNTS